MMEKGGDVTGGRRWEKEFIYWDEKPPKTAILTKF